MYGTQIKKYKTILLQVLFNYQFSLNLLNDAVNSSDYAYITRFNDTMNSDERMWDEAVVLYFAWRD
jgi:hypothetical protein